MEPTRALVESDPFSEMEKADEQMVLDEIKGRALDALVYEFRQGNQTVTGLSLAGVRETARNMNKNGQARIGISEREPVITETETYFEVKVYAQDSMNGGGYWGIKRQAKQYERGGPNAFALEQALAKAQRNALRGLIPEWFVKEMIEAWRQKGHVKTVGTRSATVNVKPSEPAPAPQAELAPLVTATTLPDPATAPTAHLTPGPIIPSKTNGGDSESDKPKRAMLRTGLWKSQVLDRAVEAGYIPDDSAGSGIRLLNVVGAAGIPEVTDDNLAQAWQAVQAHYEAKKEKSAPPARGVPALSAVQRRKLVELYRNLNGGGEEEAYRGLDSLFIESCRHGLAEASYEEGAWITAQLLAAQRAR